MKVYLSSPKAQNSSAHIMHCAPAGDTEFVPHAEAPSEWWDIDPDSGAPKPRQIPVIFRFGEAEVPNPLGKYLIDRGLASKTRLIIPSGVAA